jgi:hypothetical protein
VRVDFLTWTKGNQRNLQSPYAVQETVCPVYSPGIPCCVPIGGLIMIYLSLNIFIVDNLLNYTILVFGRFR